MIKEKKLVLRWMWHPPQVRNRVDGSIRRSRIGRQLPPVSLLDATSKLVAAARMVTSNAITCDGSASATIDDPDNKRRGAPQLIAKSRKKWRKLRSMAE